MHEATAVSSPQLSPSPLPASDISRFSKLFNSRQRQNFAVGIFKKLIPQKCWYVNKTELKKISYGVKMPVRIWERQQGSGPASSSGFGKACANRFSVSDLETDACVLPG